MKKLAILILAAFFAANIITAQTAGFTIITINNGVITKNQHMYQQQVRQLFSQQLVSLPYVKTGDASLTAKIIIDSPQVVEVDDQMEAAGQSTYQQQADGHDITTEKHVFNIRYSQKIIRVELVNSEGMVVARQQLDESPLFSIKYQHTFSQYGANDKWAGDANPTRTLMQFKNNTPPDDFLFKTSVGEVMKKFAGVQGA